jgi:hypothetical protein
MKRAETPVPQWQPIETAPKDIAARFIVGSATVSGWEAEEASWAESVGWVGNDGRRLRPTHWLLILPEPPK